MSKLFFLTQTVVILATISICGVSLTIIPVQDANPFFSEVNAQTTPSPTSDAANSNKSLEQLQSQISNLQKQYDILNKQVSNLQGNISIIQSDMVSRSNLEEAVTQGLSQGFPDQFSIYAAQFLEENNPNGWVDFNIAPNSELNFLWDCLISAANYASQTGIQGFSDFEQKLRERCQQQP